MKRFVALGGLAVSGLLWRQHRRPYRYIARPADRPRWTPPPPEEDPS